MMHVLQVAWATLQAVAPFLVVALLPSLINALLPYPSSQGAVRVLHVILELLSVLTRSDSPGTLKAPFTLSKPPASAPPPPSPPPPSSPPPSSPPPSSAPAAGIPLLALFALLLVSIPGCGPTWSARWRATGIDAAKCAAPEIGGAIGSGVIDLLDAVERNEQPDYQQIGLELAARYGADAAICMVRVAWQHLGAGSAGGGAPPPNPAPQECALAQRFVDPTPPRQARRMAALDWLVHHESEWARAAAGGRG